MCHKTFPTSFQKSRAGTGAGAAHGQVQGQICLPRPSGCQAKGKNGWYSVTAHSLGSISSASGDE
jgi:hypothetical protein